MPLGAGAFGILALFAGLKDPLAEPITTLIVVAAAVLIAIYAMRWLLGLAAEEAAGPRAEMPAWGRRRFLGTSIGVIGVAVASGLVGRALLERGRQNAIAQAGTLPEPTATAPPLPDGAELAVDGITPLVVPNEQFYRIDTALLVPRPDINTWRLRVTGMVDRAIELTYDELVAMPLVEQYVTIACVSNEVGGDLVGNALWRGVRLKELLEQAGVDPAATQIVGSRGGRLHRRVPDRLRDRRRTRAAGGGGHERRVAAGRPRLPGPADRARACSATSARRSG